MIMHIIICVYFGYGKYIMPTNHVLWCTMMQYYVLV